MNRHKIAISRADAVRRRRAMGAFTLIEVLVVIAILSVIFSIALPAYMHASVNAQRVRDVAMFRDALASIDMYASDFADGYPYLGATPDPFGGFNYFYFESSAWHRLIEDRNPRLYRMLTLYGEPSPHEESYYLTHGFTRVWLTHTVAAEPEFWIGLTPRIDRGTYRNVHRYEVAFPSNKALLVGHTSRQADYEQGVLPFGSADGSSTFREFEKVPHLNRGYTWTLQGLVTERGVWGTDY